MQNILGEVVKTMTIKKKLITCKQENIEHTQSQ